MAIYCVNPDCFAQDLEGVLHAARAFDIEGLGPQTVAALLENEIIHRAPDLFSLTVEELKSVERFADRSAQKLVEEIQAKKQISFPRFLLALGIRNVGEQTARDLATHFQTLDVLRNASEQTLQSIEHIGPIVAESVASFFKKPSVQTLLEAFQKVGVEVQPFVVQTAQTLLSGKTIVVTGTL